MIELGKILVKDNISLIEARNKIHLLTGDLGYSSITAARLATITSEIIRSIVPTKKEVVHITVGFEEKEGRYGLALLFKSKKKAIDLPLIRTFFDEAQILPFGDGSQKITTFKYIPDSTFRPTEEFIEKEKEILVRFSRAELLSEVKNKNKELLKLLDEYNITQKKLRRTHTKLQKTVEDAIYTLGKVVETRDPYTSGHQKNVSKLATFIAREMKLPRNKIEGIRIASLVHDVGKIGIPAEILSKPAKLSKIEYNLIKNHSQIGYDVLKTISFPWPIARIVLQHQERMDGSGYPNKLKGDEILLEARIIMVADVIEAMSSHRPYRPARGIDKALEEISKNKGILYDLEVVDVCLKTFKEKRFKF